MKNKYINPTKDQEVDFYYRLLVYLREGRSIGEIEEREFYKDPGIYSYFVDSSLQNWPRDTSLEENEFYISCGGMENLKYKIKITICEER